MEEHYQITENSEVPVYRQLVDAIRADIKKGRLGKGDQLPTVMVLAESLGVARGTVKRAYDELEKLGFIEKTQGRGTFVSYSPLSGGNRKDQAMSAIDTMLDSLAELGFSYEEMQIFLDLKIRERQAQHSDVKVAVIECNQENLSKLSDQLRAIQGVEVFAYLLDHVQAYPYNLDDEVDLVVTTVQHGEYIDSILPREEKVARIALRLSPKSMARIVKLQAGTRIGVVGRSIRFAKLLHDACKEYTEGVVLDAPIEFTSADVLHKYLEDKSVLLLPEEYAKYIGGEVANVLREFAKTNLLLPCSYEMDEGSVLFLREKIVRLQEKKSK